MPAETSSGRRLSDLLIEPHETLEIELKEWLDVTNDTAHKAVLAKSLLALANHGGGFVLIGFTETPNGGVPAPNRPDSLSAYTPDTINSIVRAYAEPPFHCDVTVHVAPDGMRYPIIVVPGGHRRPIRAKRAGPNSQTVQMNAYYIRRPGPQSETPQSGAEWDALISRCITNGRDDLLNQIRGILNGQATAEPPPSELSQVETWFNTSMLRWQELVRSLGAADNRRLPRGYFAVAYKLFGNLQPLRPAELREAIRRATIRHTGWPEFWVPTRSGIQPYVSDGNVECWLGREDTLRDAAHSDYWRVSPVGEAFLLRGHQEDAAEDRVTPGTTFDLTLPTWRVGEALLHAARMAREFGSPDAQVVLVIEYTGLRGRDLGHLDGTRLIHAGHTSHQDRIRTSVTAQADQISQALPELVARLVLPIYELFDFFVLPESLISQELERMTSNHF